MDHFWKWLNFWWHLSGTVVLVPVVPVPVVSVPEDELRRGPSQVDSSRPTDPWSSLKFKWINDPWKETLPRPMWNQRIKITHSTYHLIWSELSKQMWNMDLMFSELFYPGLWLKENFRDNICSLSSAWCCQQEHLSIEKNYESLEICLIALKSIFNIESLKTNTYATVFCLLGEWNFVQSEIRDRFLLEPGCYYDKSDGAIRLKL